MPPNLYQRAGTSRFIPPLRQHNLTLGQIANIANAMRLGVSVSFIRTDGTPLSAEPDGVAQS